MQTNKNKYKQILYETFCSPKHVFTLSFKRFFLLKNIGNKIFRKHYIIQNMKKSVTSNENNDECMNMMQK